MRTKLEAAEIAMNCGGAAVIANGDIPDVLGSIFAGEPVGTVFLPSGRMRGKRRWIAYAAGVRGRIVVGTPGRTAHSRKERPACWRQAWCGLDRPFAPMDVVSIVDGDGRGIRARNRQLRQPASRGSLGRKTFASSRPRTAWIACALYPR